MAFNATLSFTDSGGQTQAIFKVLSCDFGFTQNTDQTGRPSGLPLISNINLVIESTKDTVLADWMVIPAGTKSGRIEFTIQNNDKKLIEFKDAYCTQYKESFSHLGDESPMSMNISISPGEITLDGNISYTNPSHHDY